MIIWLILFLLFVKHFLADFVWQTERMIDEKGHYGRCGGIQHAGLHAVCTYVILMHFINIQACLILAIFDFVIHYHIDWVKLKLAQGLTVRDKKYWLWVGLDQLIHSLTYLVIAFVVSFLLIEYI